MTIDPNDEMLRATRESQGRPTDAQPLSTEPGEAVSVTKEMIHRALKASRDKRLNTLTNDEAMRFILEAATLTGTVRPVEAVAVKALETQDNGIATVCDGTRFRDSAEADGQASGEAGLLRSTEGSIPSYLASIGPLEAVADLIKARDADCRTVGYRSDLWDRLRSTLDHMPVWSVGSWGDGSTPPDLANIFCDAYEITVAVGLPKDIAAEIVAAHNESLATPLSNPEAPAAPVVEIDWDSEPKFDWNNTNREARQNHVAWHRDWAEAQIERIRAALVATQPAPTSAVNGEDYALRHYDPVRVALEMQEAKAKAEGREDDELYWRHEIKALDDARNSVKMAVPGEMERLRLALKPFADLAAVRYPDEGGAPSHIDIITANGEQDEIELRSHTAVSDHSVVLCGNDFRAALEAASQARAK